MIHMHQIEGKITCDISVETLSAPAYPKEFVRRRIAETGIIPAVRVSSEEDALFVAEALAEAEIPIIEVSTSFPGAIRFVSHIAESLPSVIVGAGGVTDIGMLRRCLDEGARFVAMDGSIPEVLELAIEAETLAISGALTPTEVIAAWKAGSDFIKVFPCDAVGGHSYIRSLKSALPQIRFIAAGGVNQQTASGFIAAGATALSIGKELVPAEAFHLRQSQRIQELGRRYLSAVASARP
jgi:2-dehydro-3-deoxyphosphogluconate aldolase/(4S)-4-hydroxy-2-oxoglutarate aldolase